MDNDNTSAGGILDGLFGTLDKGFDLWSKWNTQKVATVEQKAAIPSAAQPKAESSAFELTGATVGLVALSLGAAYLLFRK